jgi:hypothetical protein
MKTHIKLIAGLTILATVACTDAKIKTVSQSPSISSVSIANNVLTINGFNLAPIESLKISGSGQTTDLNIDEKNANQIKARPAAALNLVLGLAYNLLINTAQAQTVVPVTIQIDNNSLSPNALSGEGASVGQVLQWNGTNWVPGTVSGSGGSVAQKYYLAYLDGTVIGEIMGDCCIATFTLWDNNNNMPVRYANGGQDFRMTTPGDLYYTTSDCTGLPYPASIPNFGMGFMAGGVWYKLDGTIVTITTVARRTIDNQTGNLSACTAIASYTGSFDKPTVLSPLSYPFSIPVGTAKIVRQ